MGRHHTRLAPFLAALLIVAMPAFAPDFSAQVKTAPIDCNRPCLEELMEQYIAALLAHDPTRLPLSADVKYTEQEQIGTSVPYHFNSTWARALSGK